MPNETVYPKPEAESDFFVKRYFGIKNRSKACQTSVHQIRFKKQIFYKITQAKFIRNQEAVFIIKRHVCATST